MIEQWNPSRGFYGTYVEALTIDLSKCNTKSKRKPARTPLQWYINKLRGSHAMHMMKKQQQYQANTKKYNQNDLKLQNQVFIVLANEDVLFTMLIGAPEY